MGDAINLDLVPIWTAIIALGVFLYVLLDGFDLGVGILHGFAPESDRDTVMNAIAPVWDGNETWLVLGGLALFAVFPLAFAIIIPAVYFPVLLMLLALVFRGVAFEFRFRQPWIAHFWSRGFCVGSALAAFAQGSVLGAFMQGFAVRAARFRGFFVGLAHAVLGADRDRADAGLRPAGRGLADHQDRGRAASLGASRGAVLPWRRRRGDRRRQRVDAAGRSRDRPALVFAAQHHPARAGADPDRRHRVAGVALTGRLGRRCGAVPGGDGAVPDVLSRHRHQPVADDRAAALHALAGGVRRRAHRPSCWSARCCCCRSS